MKMGKWWLMFVLVAVITASTVVYVTMVKNEKTSYAHGRFVQVESDSPQKRGLL